MPVYTSSIEVTADYPTIKPSLNLNFARARALDPRITFERASTATYIGRDGLVKYAGEDEPRFDHDPDTLESLGLLIEDTETNYAPASEDYSTSTSSVEVTITTNTQISPDGTQTADTITANNTASTQHGSNKQSNSLPANSSIALSVFVKAGTSNYVKIDTSNTTNWSSNAGLSVDLSNGNIISGSGTVVKYPDGWWRITIIGVSNSSTNVPRGIWVWVANAAGSSVTSPAGTESIHVWGAQLEAGSFPTSYIPTSGSSATRARDDATIVGESFNSFYNQNEGSLFVESTPMYLASGINHRVCVITGDSNFTTSGAPGGINVDYDGTTLRTELFSGSPNSAQQGTGLTVSAGNKNKLAYGLETNNVSVIVNGAQVGSTDTSAPMPDPMTKMGIGRRPDISTTYADGIHVSSIQYYPKRLTDAQLQLLTS